MGIEPTRAAFRVRGLAWIGLPSIVFSIVWICASASAETSGDAARVLDFIGPSGRSRELPLARLREACPESEVEVDDPYHERRVRYAAISLRCVLDVGFAEEGGAPGLRGKGLLLRARDGYTRPVSGRKLLEPGAWLAFGEPRLIEAARGDSWFSRLGRREIDPGPFYLIWSGSAQNDPDRHPWPYQLTTIEVASFEKTFPKTVPRGLVPSDPGWKGYALFQKSCASCHAINGEGGKVGPDLNIPRSIVEYRPIAQIRAYIRNPQATRYTSMPAHPGFSDSDLDALIAYFSAMSERKDDSKARGGS